MRSHSRHNKRSKSCYLASQITIRKHKEKLSLLSHKQRRHYDENGSADYDIDFNHPDDGTHEFPHVHKWTNGKRPKEWIPFSEFFSLN